jgi:predicted NACHT family NTPase
VEENMRHKWLAFFVFIILMFPMVVHAQTPTPPPTLTEICYPQGEFHTAECAKALWDKWGIGGVIALVIGVLVFYLFLTPSGKAFQQQVEEKVGEWLRSFPLFRPTPTPPAEIQRREAEYLLELEKSESLRQPDEIASQFDTYLNRLHAHENPLRPSEDKVFVELESGLSIKPRIGLSIKVESNQTKSFAEQKTFNDLTEALNCVDEQTGYPYPSLALLGEPGAGKSTLLRKLARQIVQERIVDSSKPLPIFVSLSAHKSGSPLTFLRQHWKKMLGFDGLDDALASGRVWLFLDGLNEMPRTNYDTRVVEWRAFLRGHCPANANGNRALIACRIADYGEGVDVPRLIIHAMDDERIQQFLKKRTPDHADALWAALEKDRDEGRGAIYELAQIPFWW